MLPHPAHVSAFSASPQRMPMMADTDLDGVIKRLPVSPTPIRRLACKNSSSGRWKASGRSPYPGLNRERRENPDGRPAASSS